MATTSAISRSVDTTTAYTVDTATTTGKEITDITTTAYTGDTAVTTGADNTEPSLNVVAGGRGSSDSTLPIALSVSLGVHVLLVVGVVVLLVIAVMGWKRRRRKYNNSKGYIYKVSFRAEDGGSSNIIDSSHLDDINQSGVVNATVRVYTIMFPNWSILLHCCILQGGSRDVHT